MQKAEADTKKLAEKAAEKKKKEDEELKRSEEIKKQAEKENKKEDIAVLKEVAIDAVKTVAEKVPEDKRKEEEEKENVEVLQRQDEKAVEGKKKEIVPTKSSKEWKVFLFHGILLINIFWDRLLYLWILLFQPWKISLRRV